MLLWSSAFQWIYSAAYTVTQAVFSLPADCLAEKMKVTLKGNTAGGMSVVNPVVRTAGKNLFIGGQWYASTAPAGVYAVDVDGDLIKTGATSYPNNQAPLIQLARNTVYTISSTYVLQYIQVMDKDGIIIANPNNVRFVTFTTPADSLVRVKLTSTDGSIGAKIGKIQIEPGPNATVYEPYKGYNQMTVSGTYRRVPNGTHDEIDSEGNKIQRIKEYVLKAEDIIEMITITVNVDIAATSITGSLLPDAVTYDQENYWSVVEGMEETTWANRDKIESIGKFYSTKQGGFRFIFAKGTTLEQARAALNGVKIWYQAIPITTKETLSYETNSQPDSILRAWGANTIVQVSSEGALPTLEYRYPANPV